MKNRYLVTHVQINGRRRILAALIEEKNRLVEAHVMEDSGETAGCAVGNIYVGRVKNVVENIHAAFIEIAPDTVCYYPLEDFKNPIFTRKYSTRKALAAGDELLVQIKKEALKTKDPMVTTNISIPGKYVVLTTENTRLGVSSKLDAEQKKCMRELLSGYTGKGFGIIVRTNAKDVSGEVVCAELEHLIREYEKLRETAVHSTCFSCLKKEEPEYLRRIKDLREEYLEEIVTDDAAFYEQICAYCGVTVEKPGEKIRFYKDPQYPLCALYNLNTQLERALNERVWLKSGANLIIQPTEALTVIDVNTAKSTAKKEVQEQFFSVNLEAAREIAVQIRLRNLSGIILVDFVNLESKEARATLLEEFAKMLSLDPIPTALIDMTPLGLVEITRKKVQKSLAESVRGQET